MKKDDYVIAIKNSGCSGFIVGEIYQVCSVEQQNTKYERIHVYKDSVGSTTNGWCSEFFRLHEPLTAFKPDLEEILK